MVWLLGSLGSFGRFIMHSNGARMRLLVVEYTQTIDFPVYI